VFPDGTWSIGELAEQAGTTVKTVRFYSDRGLLPEAGRSSGGHRRYGPEALDRLRTIRSLRSLDLPVSEVGRALEQEAALEDAIAARLRELGGQLAALRWREAALQLLRDSPAEERADRLRLIGAITTPPSTAPMARFWRWLLPPRLPRTLLSAIIEEAVPQPPGDPSPAQVLAFARLHALTSAARPELCRPQTSVPDHGSRPAVVYEGLSEAYALAGAELTARQAPRAGDALDCFVTVHADALEAADTPAFRRQLDGFLRRTAHPIMDRYWLLAAEAAGGQDAGRPTMGAAHDWLHAALREQPAEA